MKIVANKESYGFQGKLWKKGDAVEIIEGDKYPEDHFDLVEKPKKTSEQSEAEKDEAKAKAEVERKAKMEADKKAKDEAKAKAIK